MDQACTGSSGASPASSNSRNLPKFEVSAVNEGSMKEDINNEPSSNEEAGVIVVKTIEDVDTSAVSPFIVSLPSEEGSI